MGRKYTKRVITEVNTGNRMLDRFLQMPVSAAQRVERAEERYEEATVRAGVRGMNYEYAGMLGCRVMGTGCADKDPMLDVIEASEEITRAKDKYKSVYRMFYNTLKEAGLSTDMIRVCVARYSTSHVLDMGEVAWDTYIKKTKCQTLHQQALRILLAYLLAEAEKQKNIELGA